jgi:hypothetical protein
VYIVLCIFMVLSVSFYDMIVLCEIMWGIIYMIYVRCVVPWPNCVFVVCMNVFVLAFARSSGTRSRHTALSDPAACPAGRITLYCQASVLQACVCAYLHARMVSLLFFAYVL